MTESQTQDVSRVKARTYGPDNAPPSILPTAKYRKTAEVTMWGPMPGPFKAASRENEFENGQEGDFLASDGHGGYYIISAEFHRENYELAS